MSPVMSAVEQEEALNAEREAREAREARNRSIKNRAYPEVCVNLYEKDSNLFYTTRIHNCAGARNHKDEFYSMNSITSIAEFKM